MNLTVLVGPPGTGKSKVIRERYLRAAPQAIFLDGRHSVEAVRQLRHEMGFFDHRYLPCSPNELRTELEKIEDAREIFIDMPDLPTEEILKLLQLAKKKNWHLTITARHVPAGLEEAEIVRL
ncbi:MAG: hypothetical protein GX493_02600 [Firmicutes bacterium]|nr:hypothetical protein [Bacillota bacterium]